MDDQLEGQTTEPSKETLLAGEELAGALNETGESGKIGNIPPTIAKEDFLNAEKIINPPPPAEPVKETGPEDRRDLGESLIDELSPIRTLKGDIAYAVKHRDLSMSSMAMKEARKRNKKEYVERKSRLAKFVFSILSIILILGAVAIGFYFISFKNFVVDIPFVEIGEDDRTLGITVDLKEVVDITDLHPESIKQKIGLVIRRADFRIGLIKQIVLTRTDKVFGEDPKIGEVGAIDFISGLNTLAPGKLLRQLDNEFLIGVYASKNNAGFLIFKTSTYQATFAEMLNWERNLGSDLYELLSGERFPENLLNQKWTDRVIKNIDTRVLLDENSEITMIYSFLNSRETLFIGLNEQTFNEILARFQTPNKVSQ